MAKVHLISLGCPKNLVDSEKLLKRLADVGISHSSNPDDADLILINTCGFIESAKKESIGEILNAVALKAAGKSRLAVFGCLAKRYKEELLAEIPEIDAIWGVAEEEEIIKYCAAVSGGRSLKQIVSSPAAESDSRKADSYSYLKIAEGCDRGCSYCVIPDIRGPYRSITPDQILSDAQELITSGAKELIVVAQDITSYGLDIKGYNLSRLLREISALRGDFWIRLLYLYPTAVTDELLETIAMSEKICNYIDMPLQHTEKRILGLMGRGGSRAYFEKLIAHIRDIIPDVALRSTVIVGYPQETEDEFSDMLASLKRIRFDRLGAFTYSKEAGTPAAALKGHISKAAKKSRYEKLMQMQAEISLKKNEALVGRTFRALVDESEGGIAIARLYSQAPEIDGVTIIRGSSAVPGEFVSVRITRASDYDVEGVVTG